MSFSAWNPTFQLLFAAREVDRDAAGNVGAAFAREKQIKGWLRSKKLNLIETTNPKWKDLSADWYPTAGKIKPKNN